MLFSNYLIPFIFNVVENVEKKYKNVFDYLNQEKITPYIGALSSKLKTSFKRFTSVYEINKEVIFLVIFFAESIGLKGLNDDKIKSSTINSVVADRDGSPMSIVHMNKSDVINQDHELTRFIAMVFKIVHNNSTNNRTINVNFKDYKIDEGFFFPIKKFDISELSVKFKNKFDVLDSKRKRLNKSEDTDGESVTLMLRRS